MNMQRIRIRAGIARDGVDRTLGHCIIISLVNAGRHRVRAMAWPHTVKMKQLVSF